MVIGYELQRWVLRVPPFRVVAPITLWITDLNTLVRFDPVSGIEQILDSGATPAHTVALHESEST